MAECCVWVLGIHEADKGRRRDNARGHGGEG